ncbi:hypothetical protein TRIATDRAFT_285388 [Trichoderma atroviride IMI 206040]|uniref:Uncharacterized protein n=1 Tax=Hypocrea atroviridis (strain ATCC 20476 / IMI 206040) TaxID=452589 RepID=G9P2C8_HYPAI|nr:uncharacterized protein TRIATDRAFT_285388 [Trichoderma atroviride IMI 206040]EHK42667.1 hypothetical protein TRIATDRAFT_285388 [Trichoderma atroviride IMI 206040]
MLRKLISKVVRRPSRPAKGREETSSIGDKLALLRADLDRDDIRKHVRECLEGKSKNYRMEELFVIYEDMSMAEQNSFKALYEKTKQQTVNEDWWTEFDGLWAKLWSTGSVSKKLMARNGCNHHDDTLFGAVEV